MEIPRIPARTERAFSKRAVNTMVSDFLGGRPHSSQSGALVQHLIDICHKQDIAYRVRAVAVEGRHPEFFLVERLQAAPNGFESTADATSRLDALVLSGAAYDLIRIPGSGISVVEQPKMPPLDLDAGMDGPPLSR